MSSRNCRLVAIDVGGAAAPGVLGKTFVNSITAIEARNNGGQTR